MKGDFSYTQFLAVLEGLDIRCDFIKVDDFAQVFELIEQRVVDTGIISRLYGLQFEKHYQAGRITIICCPANLAKGFSPQLMQQVAFMAGNLSVGGHGNW